MRRLSLVVASGGHSSSRCADISLSQPLLLRSTGSRHVGSVVVAHGPSCSAACGIFPDQGSTPVPCIGRQILNHCTTREAPKCFKSSLPEAGMKTTYIFFIVNHNITQAFSLFPSPQFMFGLQNTPMRNLALYFPEIEGHQLLCLFSSPHQNIYHHIFTAIV